MEWWPVALLALAWLIAPFIGLFQIGRVRRELRELRARVAAIEPTASWRATSGVHATPAASDVAGSTGSGAHPEPLPVVAARESSPARLPVPEVSTDVPREVSGVSFAMRDLGPAPTASTPAPGTAPVPGEVERLEDLIGSVWLQNAGAVVLLLGVFFFILWGYSTGRFGAGVLVAAGIGIGIAFAWRGDRLARSLPLLGHTFIGVGLGVVYLSLYLGHFTLHVLPTPLALTLLVLTSFLVIGAGLRYGVQAIAAIGVVGAFLPQLLASWIPLKGFSLEPGALLGYLACVDLLVFALTARAGWSGLDLSALMLTALAWRLTYPGGTWGWGVTFALAALFTGLGLAPLPRLAAREGRVRSLDLAVVAAAPAGLILSLWAWLVVTPRIPVAQLLLALGAVQFAAALWVDSRRRERDLWRPLTGAAVVFVTAGLQRLTGDENVAMVWCVEGVLLVLLGAGPRGGWLRLCGHVVTGIAVMVVYVNAAWSSATAGALPFVGIDALRELTMIVALLLGALLLTRGREHLAPLERRAPELWTLAANVMLLGWSWRGCDALARALEDPAGRWWQPHSLLAPSPGLRESQLVAEAVALAWFVQGATLAWLGTRSGRGFLRFGSYAVGSLALLAAVGGQLLTDGWSSDQRPVFYPAGLCALASLVLASLVIWRIGARRHELSVRERYAPELCTAALLALLLPWSAREADHVARTLLAVAGENAYRALPAARDVLERVRTLGAALTSAAWLVEALALLALGWTRSIAFLRWAGLALIGVTLLKFAFYDLASADVFWRFLTAIAAGAAMLAVSYAYQRHARRKRAAS
jgi:uncharacterized membrane protein